MRNLLIYVSIIYQEEGVLLQAFDIFFTVHCLFSPVSKMLVTKTCTFNEYRKLNVVLVNFVEIDFLILTLSPENPWSQYSSKVWWLVRAAGCSDLQRHTVP